MLRSLFLFDDGCVTKCLAFSVAKWFIEINLVQLCIGQMLRLSRDVNVASMQINKSDGNWNFLFKYEIYLHAICAMCSTPGTSCSLVFTRTLLRYKLSGVYHALLKLEHMLKTFNTSNKKLSFLLMIEIFFSCLASKCRGENGQREVKKLCCFFNSGAN